MGLLVILALAAGGGWWSAKTQFEHNPPLSMQEQLNQGKLADENALLIKDILVPTFKSVSLTGVSLTNHCGAQQKGCTGDQTFTEEEFSIYTGRGPQIGILVYGTESPITENEIQELKKRLGQASYSINNGTGTAHDGVESLFSFSVIANLGETRIIVILQPLS